MLGSPLPGYKQKIAALMLFSFHAAVPLFSKLWQRVYRLSWPNFPFIYSQQILSYLLYLPHNSLKSKTNPQLNILFYFQILFY